MAAKVTHCDQKQLEEKKEEEKQREFLSNPKVCGDKFHTLNTKEIKAFF